MKDFIAVQLLCTNFQSTIRKTENLAHVKFGEMEEKLYWPWADLHLVFDESYDTIPKIKIQCKDSDRKLFVLTSGNRSMTWCSDNTEYINLIVTRAIAQNTIKNVNENDLKQHLTNTNTKTILRNYPQKMKIKGIQKKIIYTCQNCDNLVSMFSDGTLLQFGNNNYVMPEELKTGQNKVKMLCNTEDNHAALMENGKVLTWGDKVSDARLEIHEKVCQKLEKHDVKMIVSTKGAYLVLLDNGKILAWGDKYRSGRIPHYGNLRKRKDVKMIYSIYGLHTFIVLFNDGSYQTWRGNRSVIYQPNGSKVKDIFSNYGACLVLVENGRIITHGCPTYGNQMPLGQTEKLKKCEVKIVLPYGTQNSQGGGFIVIGQNGEIISW